MCLGQVLDVNVISNTCAVRRWIVIPEDIYVGPLTKGCFKNQGDQVCLRIMIFAQLSVRVCTGCIEIPETNRFQPVRPSEIMKYLFNHEFGSSIRIYRFFRVIFCYRGFDRLPVNRA